MQRLKAALDAAGLTTWFDLDRLESGDDYDRKIRANIARCSFFVPVVSATTQRRQEAYFRREWSYAVDRTRNMADGAVFILPVLHRRHAGSRGAGAGNLPGRCTSCACRRRAAAGVPASPAGSLQREPRMNDDRRLQHPTTRSRSIRKIPGSGLFSYTEENRAYFHGRDEETAELARRVQRKLLTVLFGQSGLGKTSLLRAGLVPRLRARRLLPGLRAHRLRAGFAIALRTDQAGDLPAPPPLPVTGPSPAPRSKANRCGNSCIIAATCCAMPTATR